MYNKSFIEILGDWLDKGWKRVLLCYFLIAASGGLGMIFPPAVIPGLVLIPVIFSFKRRDESTIEKQISFVNDNGEETPCFIVKQKRFIFIPFLKFICLFHYIPHKTRYYIVKNFVAPNCIESVQVFKYPILNSEEISKSKADAIINNPEIIKSEVIAQSNAPREEFQNSIKLYFDSEAITEVFYNSQLSVLKLCDGTDLVSTYSKYDNDFIALLTNSDFIEKIINNPIELSNALFTDDVSQISFLGLNNEFLERILRFNISEESKKEQNTNKEATQQNIDQDEKIDDKQEKQKEIIDSLDENKSILTKEMIESALSQLHSKSQKGLGFLCVFITYLIGILTVSLFFIGIWYIGIPAAALLIWLIKVTKNQFTKAKVNLNNINNKKYHLEKVICTNILEQERDGGDGPDYIEYTHFFSNNDKYITNNNALGIVNDIFYLVYLEGVEGIANVYSGIHFILSPDIQCIDKTGI